MEYKAEGLYNSEEEARYGLDTCGYAGKWQKAQDSVLRDKNWLAVDPPAYWDAVRLYFLELGGEFLAEHPEPQEVKAVLKVGDIVTLNSGGPRMTVTEEGEETVDCYYWEEEKRKFYLVEDLHRDCLVLVKNS